MELFLLSQLGRTPNRIFSCQKQWMSTCFHSSFLQTNHQTYTYHSCVVRSWCWFHIEGHCLPQIQLFHLLLYSRKKIEGQQSTFWQFVKYIAGSTIAEDYCTSNLEYCQACEHTWHKTPTTLTNPRICGATCCTCLVPFCSLPFLVLDCKSFALVPYGWCTTSHFLVVTKMGIAPTSTIAQHQGARLATFFLICNFEYMLS